MANGEASKDMSELINPKNSYQEAMELIADQSVTSKLSAYPAVKIYMTLDMTNSIFDYQAFKLEIPPIPRQNLHMESQEATNDFLDELNVKISEQWKREKRSERIFVNHKKSNSSLYSLP